MPSDPSPLATRRGHASPSVGLTAATHSPTGKAACGQPFGNAADTENQGMEDNMRELLAGADPIVVQRILGTRRP